MSDEQQVTQPDLTPTHFTVTLTMHTPGETTARTWKLGPTFEGRYGDYAYGAVIQGLIQAAKDLWTMDKSALSALGGPVHTILN